MRSTLKKKRIGFVMVALVLLGGLVFFARTQRDPGVQVARRAAAGFAGQVEQSLARFGLETRSFVGSEAVHSGDPARMIPYLNSLAASYGKKFGALMILNRRGKLIAANTLDALGSTLGNDAIFARDLSGTPWFSKAVEDFTRCGNDCVSFGDIHEADEVSTLFHQSGRYFTVAAPIRHPRSGELLGVWANRISLDALGEEWNTALRGWLDESTKLALTDGSGQAFFTSGAGAWEKFDAKGAPAQRIASGWLYGAKLSTDALKYPAWQVIAQSPSLGFGGMSYWQLGLLGFFAAMLALFGGKARRSYDAFDQIFYSINDQADHLKSAASQLTSCSQDLAQSATEQASSLQQTASSIDEINSMVNQSAENAERSAKIAYDSQQTAAKGRQVVDDMIRAIGEISTSNGSILKQVEAGNQQLTDIIKVIAEIGNKTKIINDIAFQTKLLSFNASVEAARAGEHGKGFAVVAEEVGSLANMSANAAKEINDMLSGSIQTVQNIVHSSRGKVEGLIAEGKSKIESGIAVARSCETVLDEIVKAEAQMNAAINQIAGAAREQAQGIGEITKAIGMMDATTNRNASIAQQTEEFADAIASLARSLKDEVIGFRARLRGEKVTGRTVEVVEEMPMSSEPPSSESEAFAPETEPPAHPVAQDPMALVAVFGDESEPMPSASAFKDAATPAPAPVAGKAKVIPLRKSAESPLRSASTESLEETPSESDPRFKEV